MRNSKEPNILKNPEPNAPGDSEPDAPKIAKGAFSMQRVTLHRTLKDIEEMVFKDCAGLTEIIIPDATGNSQSTLFDTRNHNKIEQQGSTQETPGSQQRQNQYM